MKKLGTVKNVIHDGTILLRASETPTPGTKVYDLRGVEVGKVARVFGPVKEPYIALKPRQGAEKIGLLGTTLYFSTDEHVNHDRPRPIGRRTPREQHGRFKARSSGPVKKKGVNTWQRKEKPRKK
ncbi:MAG: Gar1/Naf1 family protein [Thermoplasmata archaeon]|nr:Gar1/Naf1 family protein [Thermoplasmata archaeon]